ncbi:MAG: fluoride efflux transporter CrcB [Acidobacteriota bacterium]|jgi:CrcB protein|nr:fluoride efflux transporter CrcB [Acidobacteriota bacterium]
MLNCVLIAIGSALGGVARYGLSCAVVSRIGREFPWDTLIVNVTGSFLIGVFSAVAPMEGRWFYNTYARNCFMIGICGGYTTFSSFSLQTLSLAQNGRWLCAFVNAALSLELCFASVWLGTVAAGRCE